MSESNRETIVFLAPHQDDELLGMGVAAHSLLKRKKPDVHVVLCTDGSRSSIRAVLGNGLTCNKQGNKQGNTPEHTHCFELSIEEFIAARDREFKESCAALGYSPENVHVLDKRCIDGESSVEVLGDIIKRVLEELSPSEVHTFSPFVGSVQHIDHKNMGLAALELFKAGSIKKLALYVEPYFLHAFTENNPGQSLQTLNPGFFSTRHLKKAIDAYRYWSPDEGRYAIGLHSVTSEFDNFLSSPQSFCYYYEEV